MPPAAHLRHAERVHRQSLGRLHLGVGPCQKSLDVVNHVVLRAVVVLGLALALDQLLVGEPLVGQDVATREAADGDEHLGEEGKRVAGAARTMGG